MKTTDKTTPATVEVFRRLQAETYTAYNVTSKPAGDTWIKLTLDLAKRILETPGLSDRITDEILDQLTEENAHTARHAAEVVRHLKKYTI